MPKDFAARDAAIYHEFMRVTHAGGYTNRDALHRALGIQFSPDKPLSPNTVRKILGEQRRVQYAETNGLPLDAVPPGFFIKKVSTLLDADGNTITQSIQSVNESRRTTEHQDAIPPGIASRVSAPTWTSRAGYAVSGLRPTASSRNGSTS